MNKLTSNLKKLHEIEEKENISKIQKLDIYLKQIISDEENIKINKIYVELLGKESEKDIDNIGVEIMDERSIINKLKLQGNQNSFNTLDTSKENRIDSILKIEEDTNQFILMGESGSGKSTTLHKILYNNAKAFFEGKENIKIPVLIDANQYNKGRTFVSLIREKLEIENLSELFQQGDLQIIIDGLNEVSEDFEDKAKKEIKQILKVYPENSIIISTRKHAFSNSFNLPVFELKELQDKQIKDYILKYSKENFLELWNDINENEHLYSLSQNPLTLKIILIVSNKGEKISNRANLYYSFFKTLFDLENQKNESIEKDIKIKILCFLAYSMREKGEVRVAIGEALSIIQKIQRKLFFFNYDSIDILKELERNSIIKLSRQESITFTHESYLEFFTALELKEYFYKNKKIKIEDLSNSYWKEPISMCSDLFTDESNAFDFFEYLFKGNSKKEILEDEYDFDLKERNKENKPKKISSFSFDDFNENINIAAHVALNLRERYPKIYHTAEIYLSNYMNIYLSKFYKNGFINYEKYFLILFDTIATLSSPKLFYKILIDFDWVYLWLYTEELETMKINSDKSKEEKAFFNHISFSISRSLKDFTLFYFILDKARIYHSFSRSIIINLNNLRRILTYHIPLNKLIYTYKILKDEKLLIEIGKYDMTFFKENLNFDTYDIGNYLDFIRKYHSKNENGLNELFFRLKSLKIGSDLWYDTLYHLFDLKFDEKILLEYIEKYIENLGSDKNYKKLISYFQCIRFENLQEKIKNLFITPEKKNFFSKYSDISISNSNNIKLKLDIDYKNLLNLKKSSSNYFIKVVINEKYSAFVKGVTSFNENLENKFLSISLLDERNLENITENGIVEEVSGPDSLILTEPLKFHPDLIRNNHKILHILDYSLKENKKTTINFIQELGITYLFHSKIESIKYGIVIDIYKNKVQIFDFTKKEFDYFPVHDYEKKKYYKEQIVTIEKNAKLGIIEQDNYDEKIGFETSTINQINADKREGFIYNKEKYQEFSKDFFFSFDSCDFSPYLGDLVKFIPAKNNSKHYVNLPMALKIHKEGSITRKCKIIKVFENFTKTNIKGIAIDLESKEYLRFKIEDKHMSKIKNCEELEEEQIFEYILVVSAKEENKKNILLLKLLI